MKKLQGAFHNHSDKHIREGNVKIGAFVVTLDMLWRLINCHIIIINIDS